MKRTILLTTFLLLIGFSISKAVNVTGTITTNTTWTLANSPYIVTGGIIVNNGVTLTIQSGVIVKFNANLGIVVNGTLKARQAQFTSNITPLAKGAWNNIQAATLSSVVTLDTCNVDYGGSSNQGAIYANLGTVNLTGTIVTNSSSSGLYLNTGSVNLKNSSISACDYAILYNSCGNIKNNGGNTLSGNKYDAAFVNFTNVTKAWSLPTLPIPYIINQNLYVNSTVAMQVDSGAVLKFNSGKDLVVEGLLKARKAQFTSNVTPLAKGAWDNIRTATATSIVILDTCQIEYGGSGNEGSVYAYLGTITLNNTTIKNSSTAGVQLYKGTLNMKNSSITLCEWPIIYTQSAVLHNIIGNTFTGNKYDAAYIYFTTLSSAWNLERMPIPFVFYYDFTIGAAGNMTVASGNALKSAYKIYVDGILNAVATQNDNIIFTSANNDNVGGDTNNDGAASLPARGSWGGIHFRNTSVDASCILRRCNITYAGSSNGGIIIENANTTIDSCSFANNYYGAEIIGASKPIFTNNTIASSYAVPIAMSFDSEPVFLNNTLSFSDNQYDAIGLLGGTMTANAHLVQRDVTGIPNITYLMLGELTIPQAYTLTIDSGIVIKSYYGIIVQGALIANGKAGANQVIFTSVKDDNVGNPSDTNKDGTQTNPIRTDWTGLIFEETSDDAKCLLNYTQVKYATMQSKYYYSQYLSGGAVTLINASPTISNSTIKDVTYGLYAFQASNPKVSNSEFTNSLYTPIAFSVSANPTFTNLKFTNNAWTALGIIGEKVGINGTIAKRNVAGFNNISYVLLADLTINSGTNVTVSPGVVLKMQQDIIVEGGFKAEGLVNDSITFTSINDDNYGTPKDTRNDGNAVAPAKGNWGTIQFNATTNDAFSTFNYVRLLYGSSSTSKGILTFTDAGNTIKNTTISDAGNYGVRIEGSSNPDLTNGVVIKNCQYDPIAMSLTSNPKFNFTSPLFNFLGNGSNGIRIIEGNLSTNATLVKRDVGQIYNVAYIVENLTVMPNTTLTIGEGVVIKFPNTNYYWQNNGINVDGALVALGSVKSPIVFTSIKDDSKGGDTNGDGNTSVPDKGNWGSILFKSSSLDNSNLMRNCLLNYGGSTYSSGDGQYKEYGNIRVFNAKLTVDSCRIEHSSTSAIGVYGSATPIIKNNEMNNIAKTPITMSLFAIPTFSNNKISNIGINAIGIAPENYAIDATIPKMNFAGYSNMTYYMYGTSKVNSGTQITIPKGITFKTANQTVFDVEGKLTINGTQTEPVVFTNLKNDAYGNPLDTENDGSSGIPPMYDYAITFQDISDDLSAINYAIFDYFDEGVRLLQASPTIQNCKFKNSNWGVVLNGVSNPAINNNVFDNLKYTPITISLVSYPASSVGNTISGSTYKAIGIISEELVQDATLSKRNFGGIDNIPYYFTGNYTVGTSVTLTVKPGVVSKFADNAKLNVKRGLMAVGGSTADSTIVFTSIKDDFYGGDTNADSTATSAIKGQYIYGWDGINFEDVALDNLCKIDHAILKFAGSSSYSAISMTAASPTITNSLITQNGNGIEIKGSSNPKINNCDFSNNTNFAVNNVNQAFNVDATNCWWGDNSGPTHASNIGGNGGKISDKVQYSPWKTTGAANPLTGDVSLNGSVQAYDASLVLQHVVSLVTLNSIQKKVADVSGDGTITSFDASLILQNVAGITGTFPGEMKSPGVKSDVILSFGNETKSAEKLISIPLLIENGNRSMAFDIATTFDTTILEPIAVTAGKDTKNNLFVYNFDHTAGKVLIGIAGTENLSAQAEVANITFRILDTTTSNAFTNLGIDKFKANETDFTLSAVAKTLEISKIVSGIDNLFASTATFSVYPNPIKSTSKIQFNVAKDGTQISIALYDLAGRQIDMLLNGIQTVGLHSIDLNNLNRGIYLLKMVAGSDTQFQKIIVE